MASQRLSDRQQLFVVQYLATLNGTEAARLAGYKGSDNALGVAAHRLLRNAKVRAAIDEGMRARLMSAEEVLARLGDMAAGDLGEFIGQSADELKRHPRRRLIRKLKTTVTTTETGVTERVELELYSAQEALALIGKYYKLFAERFEHTGQDGKPIQVDATLHADDFADLFRTMRQWERENGGTASDNA